MSKVKPQPKRRTSKQMKEIPTSDGKDVQLYIRVPREVRDIFADAAKKDERSMALFLKRALVDLANELKGGK